MHYYVLEERQPSNDPFVAQLILANFEAQGLQVIGKMFDGPIKAAFLHPKSSKGILFELTEEPSLESSEK